MTTIDVNISTAESIEKAASATATSDDGCERSDDFAHNVPFESRVLEPQTAAKQAFCSVVGCHGESPSRSTR